MMDAADLLGKDYSAIAAFPPLAEVKIPERERIDGRSHISLRNKGIEFLLEDHRMVGQVTLHAEGDQGFCAYPQPLPDGLAFGMSCDRVRALLGEPESYGEATTLPVLGVRPPWDRFRRSDYLVHIQYDDEEAQAIRSITVMPVTAAP